MQWQENESSDGQNIRTTFSTTLCSGRNKNSYEKMTQNPIQWWAELTGYIVHDIMQSMQWQEQIYDKTTQQDIMMGASNIVHHMMKCQEQICDNMTQRLYMDRTYTLFIVYKFTVGGKNWKDVDRNTIIV